MYTNEPLTPEMESIRRELDHYHTERLYAAQARRTRKGIVREMDGQYSITRLITAIQEDRVRQAAPFEYAEHERIAERLGRGPTSHGSYFVPVPERRDVSVATAASLTDTQLAPGDLFVPALLAQQPRGIQIVSVGAAAATIPRISTSITTGWLSSETATATESDYVFVQISGSPKTAYGFVELSNQWLRQTSPEAQRYVWNAMGTAVGTEVFLQLIKGDGASGRVQGILNVAGVGSVSGTTLAFSGILDAIKSVEDASAVISPASAGFLLAPDTAKITRSREKASGSGMIQPANDIVGYPVQVSKVIPDSSLLFADFSQIALLDWGALEISTDPYGVDSARFVKGLTGLRCLWSCDVCVLNPKSFCKIVSIT
jgi:hypothetical protein